MAKIFISYSSTDKEFVLRLSEDLRGLGHAPWLDEWEVRVGDSIPAKIAQGLTDCQYLVVVLSRRAIESGWVQREWSAKYWEEVASGGVLVLPALIENCEIPVLLRTKKYADFRTNYTLGFVNLVSAVLPDIREVDEATGSETLLRDFSDITNLVAKIQSRRSPLAECLADAVGVARKHAATDLAEFCKMELSGYENMSKEDIRSRSLQYRLIEIVFSPMAKLNLQFVGWGQSVSELLDYARNDKHFHAWKMFVPNSVSSLEQLALQAAPNRVMTMQMRMGDMLPDTDHPDHPVFGYADPRSYVQVVETIRARLTERLLTLLPG